MGNTPQTAASERLALPSHWTTVKLEEVVEDFLGGGTPSTSKPDYWDGNIPWMTSAHITGRTVASGECFITEKGLNESATHVVPKDNLLVATRVGIGKVAVNTIDVAISQDLTGVVLKKDKLDPDYACWFLLQNSHALKSMAQGSTIKGLLKKDLAQFEVVLPPLSEQRKIAEILGSVDETLALERKRKEKLERVKTGLMNDLLTGKRRVRV